MPKASKKKTMEKIEKFSPESPIAEASMNMQDTAIDSELIPGSTSEHIAIENAEFSDESTEENTSLPSPTIEESQEQNDEVKISKLLFSLQFLS